MTFDPSTLKFNEAGLIPAIAQDATSGEVIWTKFYNHTIFRQDTNVVLSHLSADMCKHFMSIGELNAKHRIR